MKKLIILLILTLLALSVAFTGTAARKGGKDPKVKKFQRQQVIVKFSDSASQGERNQLRRKVSGWMGRRLKKSGLEKIYLSEGMDEQWVVEILRRDPSVVYADLNYTIEFLQSPSMLSIMPTLVPDDLKIYDQWHLDTLPYEDNFANGSSINVDVDIVSGNWELLIRQSDISQVMRIFRMHPCSPTRLN